MSDARTGRNEMMGQERDAHDNAIRWQTSVACHTTHHSIWIEWAVFSLRVLAAISQIMGRAEQPSVSCPRNPRSGKAAQQIIPIDQLILAFSALAIFKGSSG